MRRILSEKIIASIPPIMAATAVKKVIASLLSNAGSIKRPRNNVKNIKSPKYITVPMKVLFA